MKKGKFITIGNYNNIRIGYGTVDSKNLKTIYIKLNSWIEPNVENFDFNKSISKTQRKIKEIIYNTNLDYFKKDSIVDLDIKTNGIKKMKKSFMDLEITLFVNKFFDVRCSEIKTTVDVLSKNIINNILLENPLFIFFEKKENMNI